jgi:hypothetical protein
VTILSQDRGGRIDRPPRWRGFPSRSRRHPMEACGPSQREVSERELCGLREIIEQIET